MRKKLKRLLISLVVSATMLVTTVCPAFAAEETTTVETETVSPRAGTETWTGSGHGGSYTFNNYNLTPVKTMGESGRLLISGSFYGTDGYASSSPIKLTVQIRSTSGAILVNRSFVDDRSGNVPFSISVNVTAGQKVQLYFDASSIANPPGIYRSAFVEYDFVIL